MRLPRLTCVKISDTVASGIRRLYAAIIRPVSGEASALGAVRSKNDAIASAGTLYPIVEWGRLRL